MFLRYAYSPSFQPGWAIGVLLVVPAEVGSASISISEGFVYSIKTKRDAYIRACDLNEAVKTTLTPAEIEPDDLTSIVQIASEVSLSPSLFPWVSMDGSLSSLAIDAGDSSMTAEWNTEHPERWIGLEALHSELKRLFTKYH